MSSFRNIVAIALVFHASLAYAGSLKPQTRVIGGSSAAQAQFPYQVSLHEIYSGQHFCGGAIIHEYFILTAAHCFFQLTAQSLSFYGMVNKTDASDDGIRVEFRGVIPHPDFGIRGPHPDIALMITKDPIRFSDFVKPINLPTQGDIESGTEAVISGWGIYKEPNQFPTTLQYKRVTKLSLSECKAEFDRLKKTDIQEWRQVISDLSDDVICTKNYAGSGSCSGDSGDSGGPLVADNALIGLVSWSVGCSDGYPSVFTRVFPRISWIKQQMEENQA